MSLKEKIPCAVRNSVWSLYIGPNYSGLCCCCNFEPITKTNFECGHILSEKNGGKVHLLNLRPICSACNKSVGTKNMESFMEQYGFVKNKNWNNKPNSDLVIDSSKHSININNVIIECDKLKTSSKLISKQLIRKIGMFLPESNTFSNIKYLDKFKIFDVSAKIKNELFVFKIISRNKYSENGILNSSYNLITSADIKNLKQEIKLLGKENCNLIHYCFIIVPVEKKHDCIYYWDEIENIKENRSITIKTSPQFLENYNKFGFHRWRIWKKLLNY